MIQLTLTPKKRWLLSRLSNHHSLSTTVLFRTSLIQMIICIYFNIVRRIYAFSQCDHNPLGKLVLYQTCQVRWSCLGTPSFDKGYCRPSIDPVAKFLSRRTTIINFGKTNEIYKLPEKFFAFLETSHCIPHPMLIQVAANLPMDVANHRQLIIFVSCHPQTVIK